MYAALRDLGIRIPDDVALISVDDFAWAPPLGLTVVAQPAYEMGKLAAQLIVTRQSKPTQKVLKPQLIARGSCGEALAEDRAFIPSADENASERFKQPTGGNGG